MYKRRKFKVQERIIILSEQTETVKSKGMPKKVITILMIGLLICGGGVAAFFIAGKSDKAKYFKAEMDTYEFLETEVKDRFQLELDWLQVAENNPIESTVDISAEFNDPGFFGYGMMIDIEEIINNSKITISGQTDMKKKQLAGEFNADIAGLQLSDLRFGLTEEFALVDLPFLNETLKLESKDTGKFLNMLDPYTFEEDMEVDFAQVFDNSQPFLTEEDRKHFSKEYGQMIYNEIPESAFTSEKESVDIDGKTVKAEKIAMDLSEEEVQQIIKSVLEKMQKDDYLKDLMKEQFEMNFLSQSEIDEMMVEFDEGIAEAIEEVENINVPNGINSTVWIDSGLIVQRSFEMKTIDEYDNEATIGLFGTQLLDKTAQKLDYDLTLVDDFDDITINLAGDFSRDGEKIADTFALSVDEFEIKYEADETLTSKDRDFTRSIGFSDGWDSGALVWSGNATYEKDQMEGSHQFYIEAEGLGQDLFSLHLDVKDKKIKEVDMINDENVLDIGQMSEEELYEYIEYDAADQFMEWYFGLLGDMGGLMY